MQKENLYTTDCIRTVSGKYVNVFNPQPEMLCIEDIAHALSFQCRFGGHLPNYYTVAQHSILVSNLLPAEHKFSGLMHDASEAYLLDVPRPIKYRLANYKEIEHTLMMCLAEKFGFTYPLHDDIHSVDKILLEFEWKCIMLQQNVYPSFTFLTAEQAKYEFLKTFYNLK